MLIRIFYACLLSFFLLIGDSQAQTVNSLERSEKASNILMGTGLVLATGGIVAAIVHKRKNRKKAGKVKSKKKHRKSKTDTDGIPSPSESVKQPTPTTSEQ